MDLSQADRAHACTGPDAGAGGPQGGTGLDHHPELRDMSYDEAQQHLSPMGECGGYSAIPGPVNEHPLNEKATLSHARFTPHRTLKKIRKGQAKIGAGDSPSGKHVKAVQRALVDMGFDLVIYASDGGWGSETSSAVAAFQSTVGVTSSGDLNARTMEELDKGAPGVKDEIERFVDYDRLLKDGILDFTIGMGFDEGTGVAREMADLIPRVGPELGLEAADQGTIEALYKEKGQTAPKYDCSNFWMARDRITVGDNSAHVIVRLFSASDNDKAGEDFVDAMANSDVTLYGGHGRYGSGPDFDRSYVIERRKSDGSYEEIDKYKLERIIGGDVEKLGPLVEDGSIRILMTNEGNIQLNDANALKSFGSELMFWVLDQEGSGTQQPTRTDPASFEDRYKVWFFNGCTTKHYIPSVRADGVSSENTDMVGTGDTIGKLSDGLMIQMKGIIEQQPIQEIVRQLNESYGMKEGKKGFRASGFGDNPAAAGG